MNLLAKLLSSRARAQIFRLLFDGSGKELHIRELERRTGFVVRTVQQELSNLLKLDMVKKRKDGNRVYYRANESHALYKEICAIVTKTVGLADILGEALADEGISVAFVFGSLAGGIETGTSDVDLMIIGKLGLRHVATLLGAVENKIGREIHPIVMTEDEFSNKLRSGDHFITRILEGPKLFIKGTQHDLEAMG